MVRTFAKKGQRERFKGVSKMVIPENEAYDRICVTSSEGAEHCAGKRCMAWRSAPPNGAGQARGFCGLAGKPSEVVFSEAGVMAEKINGMLLGGGHAAD